MCNSKKKFNISVPSLSSQYLDTSLLPPQAVCNIITTKIAQVWQNLLGIASNRWLSNTYSCHARLHKQGKVKKSSQQSPACKHVSGRWPSLWLEHCTHNMPTKSDTIPYRVEKDGGIWCMVYDTSTSEGSEEVVAGVQGVLSKNRLPPFLDYIG